MPVGRGENHGLQLVMLVRHFQQQIVFVAEDFLNNGFEGAIVPHHLNLNGNAGLNIKPGLFFDPGATLADNALAHCRPLIGRQQGCHLIGKIVDRQKGFDASTNPLV